MTREEKLQKAHQMFDNRNLLTELKWQREYFKRGYISNQEELFNLWIFDECIKALEQESKSEWEQDHAILKAYSDGANEVLDKIKENIQFIKDKCLPNTIAEEYEQKGLQEALDIIDRYKAESEDT